MGSTCSAILDLFGVRFIESPNPNNSSFTHELGETLADLGSALMRGSLIDAWTALVWGRAA